MAKKIFKMLMCLYTVFLIAGITVNKPAAVKAEGADYVAVIGESYYTNLNAALDAVTGEQTIVLLEDVSSAENISISNDYDFAIDLNGKTLDLSGQAMTLSGMGTLTIKDSSIGNTGKITGTGEKVIRLTGKNLILESGTLEKTGIAGSVISNESGATVTISGGNVNFYLDNGMFQGYYLIHNSSNGSIEINGGNLTLDVNTGIYSYCYGIYNSASGSIIISEGNVSVICGGGTISNYAGIYNESAGSVAISGGNVSVNGSNEGYLSINCIGIYNESIGSVVISGGNVNANTGIEPGSLYFGIYNFSSGEIDISGGKLEANTSAVFLEDGHGYNLLINDYIRIKSGPESYITKSDIDTVTKLRNYSYLEFIPVLVAKIGETDYYNLITAFQEVAEGHTMKLMTDIIHTRNFSISNSNNFTLDLNGYTINQQSYNITYSGAGTLTITDSSPGQTGKITGTGLNVIVLTSGKILNLVAGTLEKTGNGGCVISNESTGSITINGGYVSVNAANVSGYNFIGINNESTGSINVVSGKVTVTAATGSFNSYYGIYNNGSVAEVIISGGEVSITGGNGDDCNYIAIFTGSSYNVEVNSGIVNVSTGSGSNNSYFGIKNQDDSTVTISGGEVSVTGDSSSAGYFYGIHLVNSGNMVTLTGGEVKVSAGSGGGERSFGIFFDKAGNSLVYSSGKLDSVEYAVFFNENGTLTINSQANIRIYAIQKGATGSAGRIEKSAINSTGLINNYKYIELKYTSDTPATVNNTVNKSSIPQKAVSFELTVAPTGNYKVYDSEAAVTPLADVTVSVAGTTLTLTHTGDDLPEGSYYISVTENGKDESDRLALTVAAPVVVTVSGIVTDINTNTAIVGASVQLKSEGSNIGSAVTTNGSGAYSISGVFAGLYTVEVSAAGYNTVTSSVFVVATENVSGINLSLTAPSPAPTPTPSNEPQEIAQGIIEKEQEKDNTAPRAYLNNSIEELKSAVLTPEEQARVDNGENARIILKITDISNIASEEEKKLIEEALAAENESPEEDEAEAAVMYIDMTLYKQIGNQGELKVTETSSKISISIEIPEELRNTELIKARKFYVVRIHNGEITKLEGTYDEVNHIFTFETDRFSTYALAYQDTILINTYNDFYHLQLTAKEGKTTQTLSYNRYGHVDGYLIYGGECGGEMRLLADLPTKVTSYTDKNLKQATNYKYQVKAYKLIDGKRVIIMTSKVIHTITEGKKYGNPVKVVLDTTAVKLNVADTKTLTGEVLIESAKLLKEHTAVLRYESTNTEIATVNSKGKITAKDKGSCYVYVYAQNGVYKRIKVTVE